MSNPFGISQSTLVLIEQAERATKRLEILPQPTQALRALISDYDQMAALMKAAATPWFLAKTDRLLAELVSRRSEMDRLVAATSSATKGLELGGIAIAAKDFERLAETASFGSLRREIDAMVAGHSNTFARLEDALSKSLSRDLAGLESVGIGARIGLDDATAAILGLRTNALFELATSAGTAPPSFLNLEAALQGRVLRVISEPSSDTKEPEVRVAARAAVADRLPEVLERWDPKLALKLREQRAAVGDVSADPLRMEGWVTTWRKLLERILRDATPHMPSRRPRYGARFDTLVKQRDPATAQAALADKAAFDALICAISVPAHELDVRYTPEELLDVRLRSENFLLTIISLARPDLMRS